MHVVLMRTVRGSSQFVLIDRVELLVACQRGECEHARSRLCVGCISFVLVARPRALRRSGMHSYLEQWQASLESRTRN